MEGPVWLCGSTTVAQPSGIGWGDWLAGCEDTAPFGAFTAESVEPVGFLSPLSSGVDAARTLKVIPPSSSLSFSFPSSAAPFSRADVPLWSSTSSSSMSDRWYIASWGRGQKPLVTTPGWGSRIVAKCGLASCCQWWSVSEPVKSCYSLTHSHFFNPPTRLLRCYNCTVDQPSMGLTIWSFSGRKVLKTLEPREISDKLEKEEITLPMGELHPVPSPSDSACSFLSRSAWKNWRSQRKFCRRSDSRWRAWVRSFPRREPGCPSRNSSLQGHKFSNRSTKSDRRIHGNSPTDPWTDWKGCAVITRGLRPEPGIGGVAGAHQPRSINAEALMERTVWKTLLWDDL